MKNVPLKNWLKKVKNYYKTLRWLRENNVKGKVEMDKEFYDFLSELTNVILLAPLDYLIIYWGYIVKVILMKNWQALRIILKENYID